MLDYEKEITLNTEEGSETETTTTTPTTTVTPTTNPPPTTAQCENCIETKTVEFDKCEPIKDESITIDFDGEGKWLRINLTVKGVCKARNVAAGILIEEIVDGKEVPIAFKTIVLPKSDANSSQCENRTCDCAKFAIPPKAAGGCEGKRTFKVSVFANHLLDSNTTIAPCKLCQTV